jgi:type IV pilus assembly protein PilY1
MKLNGASSAAATSALELVAGDNNLLYSASYTTGAWTGDLAAYVLTGETGEASKIKKWSSQALLDAQGVCRPQNLHQIWHHISRLVHLRQSVDNAKSYTSTISAIRPSAPSQCASLQPKAKAAANLGANLVNYLRGDRTYEADVGFKEDAHFLRP